MIVELTAYREQYLAALRDGDEAAARDVVNQARNNAVDPDTVYYEIFAPSMVRIGELWEQNELSVAEEHLATAITERLIAQLSPWFSQPAAQDVRGSVVLGCVEGERHTLGLRMLADLFRKQGWRVLYLGADVPTADWVRLTVRYAADAVAISAGAQRRLPAVRSLIEELRAVQPEIMILVGGALFNADPALWQAVGASYYHPDPITAVATITARCALRDAQRAMQDIGEPSSPYG